MMKKYVLIFLVGWLGLATCLFITPKSRAQDKDYPNQPITLIVPWGAGGASDQAARAVARFAPNYLGQQMIVVNKPGAGGAVGMETVIRSKPDGYTLLSASIGSNTLTPAFQANLPFKFDEVTFICRTQLNPAVLVVKAEASWKTLKDLVEDVKKNPGKFMYGTSGIGSMHNWATYKFLKAAGIDMKNVTMIPFNSGKEQVVAMLGGNIHFSYMNLSEPYAQLKAGRLKALALAPKRMEEVPNVPTFAELGYPQVNIMGWRGVSGPPNLPEGIVKKLEQGMEKLCRDPAWIDMVVKMGDLPAYIGPKDFKSFVTKEYKEAKNDAESLGIK
jgi:tripartite-type tricarboxylate transporter receptor subunit TctC